MRFDRKQLPKIVMPLAFIVFGMVLGGLAVGYHTASTSQPASIHSSTVDNLASHLATDPYSGDVPAKEAQAFSFAQQLANASACVESPAIPIQWYGRWINGPGISFVLTRTDDGRTCIEYQRTEVGSDTPWQRHR